MARHRAVAALLAVLQVCTAFQPASPAPSAPARSSGEGSSTALGLHSGSQHPPSSRFKLVANWHHAGSPDAPPDAVEGHSKDTLFSLSANGGGSSSGSVVLRMTGPRVEDALQALLCSDDGLHIAAARRSRLPHSCRGALTARQEAETAEAQAAEAEAAQRRAAHEAVVWWQPARRSSLGEDTATLYTDGRAVQDVLRQLAGVPGVRPASRGEFPQLRFVDSARGLAAVGEALSRSVLMGLDTESKPSNCKGCRNRTALLQIATRDARGAEDVFLLDLLRLLPRHASALDAALLPAFASRNVLKVGHGLMGDLRELHDFYPFVTAFERIEGAVEANALHRAVTLPPLADTKTSPPQPRKTKRERLLPRLRSHHHGGGGAAAAAAGRSAGGGAARARGVAAAVAAAARSGVVPGRKRENDISLRALTEVYLGCRLDKAQQCSNWAQRPLSPRQQHYAACDALVLLRLHDALAPRLRERAARAGVPSLSPRSLASAVAGAAMPKALNVRRLLHSRTALPAPPPLPLSHAVAAAVAPAAAAAAALGAELRGAMCGGGGKGARLVVAAPAEAAEGGQA